MAQIIDLAEGHRKLREEIAAEILHADRHPERDPEADRLLNSLGEVLTTAPVSEEEKLVALYTKLIDGLASIESESERKAFADKFAGGLRHYVEAAVDASSRM